MKIHDGHCQGNPCSRTHAYKCRLCQIWFPQDLIDLGGTALRASPFYPYCSGSCAASAVLGDKGFHMFERFVDKAMETEALVSKYPDPLAHQDFNQLIRTAKEL